MMNSNTTEKITKEQIMKIIELKGSFYAKSTHRGQYGSSITYNDIRVIFDREGHLMMTLFCNRVENDSVIDEKEFRLIDGKWIECFDSSSSISEVPIPEDINDLWIFILNGDREFIEYARYLLKILAE